MADSSDSLDRMSGQQHGHAAAPELLTSDGARAAAAATVGGGITDQGEAATDQVVATSTSDPEPDGHQTSSGPNAQNKTSQLPLGYMLVSVRLQGQRLLEELPVEVRAQASGEDTPPKRWKPQAAVLMRPTKRLGVKLLSLTVRVVWQAFPPSWG